MILRTRHTVGAFLAARWPLATNHWPRVFSGRRGQTLILGVMAMVVLLLAIIFLFDLQNVIRIKVKSQTGADAAALASAHWQMHTLNLIGELNLVKACTTLVSDIPPFGEDSEAAIEQKSALLCEMQARASFVGPLVGFAAAQQAAKNNGVNTNGGYTEVVSNHLARLLDDTFYGDPPLSQEIEGYAWRTPYSNMLDTIAAQGIAVAPNTQFLGAPRLEGNEFVSYLADRNVYDAINANYWCYIRELIRMDFTGKWWGDIELVKDSTSFPEEAEYVTVDIEFFTGAAPYNDAKTTGGFATAMKNRSGLELIGDAYDRYEPGQTGDTDGKIDPLPHLRWATYGQAWASRRAPDTNHWSSAEYLRSDLKPEYVYAGAVSKMVCRSVQKTMSGMWDSKTDAQDQKSLGESISFSDKKVGEKSFKDYGDRLKRAEEQMKYGLDDVIASALAKPLGKLTPEGMQPTPPNYSNMILPVFDKASIIPVAMGDPGGLDPFDYEWYAFITEYLPTLGTVNSISDMGPGIVPIADHWPWFISRHNALLKLDDPAWRQQGIDWLDTMTYKYVDDGRGGTTEVENGTNESHCDDWPPGGHGGGGPGIVH